MNIKYPSGERGIVSRMAGSLFPYQGWPTVAVDNAGQLYAAASSFRARHVCPFGKTALYKSTDGGSTWSLPTVINDSYMDDRDAGLVHLGEGKLLLSWFSRNPIAYRTPRYEKMLDQIHPYLKDAVYTMTDRLDTLTPEEKAVGSYIRVSADGVTWGSPVQVPVMAPHGPNLCSDGTLIYLGIGYHAPDGLPGGYAACYASTDGGDTWQRRWMADPRQWVAEGAELCEPHILPLPDGTLLGALRLDQDGEMHILTTCSRDGGYTWTTPVNTGIIGGPPHLLLHSSGAVILSYGRRVEPYGQRAAVSYDKGISWQDVYVLDTCLESKDLGYASTAELPDGSLITVYYQRCPGDNFGSILYKKWALEG